MRTAILTIVIILSVIRAALADQYFGIFPGATFTEVKEMYPNATFTDLKPVWLKEDERLVSIFGSGLEGTITVFFFNDLLGSKKQLQNVEIQELEGKSLESLKNLWQSAIMRYEAGDDPWLVEHIRWAPPNELKLFKFIKRYGKPDTEEIDENMNTFKVWNKNYNIKALIDDKNIISLVVYGFTAGDHMCTPKWREGKYCNPREEYKGLTKNKKIKKRKK